MSAALVESFASDFTPDEFTDEYQEELRALIDAKLKKGDTVDTEETFGEQAEEKEEGGGEVLDLMEALRRSVERSRDAKKPSAHEPAEKKTTRKAKSTA
jgi:DNA end-binding protein Ku